MCVGESGRERECVRERVCVGESGREREQVNETSQQECRDTRTNIAAKPQTL